MSTSWEVLVWGTSDLSPLRQIRIRAVFCSMVAYIVGCFIYRCFGICYSLRYLDYLRDRFILFNFMSEFDQLRLARRLMVPMVIVGRCVFEKSGCLANSVSLCAGLIAFGLKAQLVIGKPDFLANPRYDFHAWVELNGAIVNGSRGIQIVYHSLVKRPLW